MYINSLWTTKNQRKIISSAESLMQFNIETRIKRWKDSLQICYLLCRPSFHELLFSYFRCHFQNENNEEWRKNLKSSHKKFSSEKRFKNNLNISCLNFQFMMHNCQMRNTNINEILSWGKQSDEIEAYFARLENHHNPTSILCQQFFILERNFVKSLFTSLLD